MYHYEYIYCQRASISRIWRCFLQNVSNTRRFKVIMKVEGLNIKWIILITSVCSFICSDLSYIHKDVQLSGFKLSHITNNIIFRIYILLPNLSPRCYSRIFVTQIVNAGNFNCETYLRYICMVSTTMFSFRAI